MNPTIRCRLICGDEELDIHDWGDYVLTANGFSDEGNVVTLRWQTPTTCARGGAGNLQRLVGELRKYLQKAKLYEQENIGDPLYLAVYWPECEDIPVPCFGRGWRYKRITYWATLRPGRGGSLGMNQTIALAHPILHYIATGSLWACGHWIGARTSQPTSIGQMSRILLT